MCFHLVYFKDWQTGNDPSQTFWELLDTELLEGFGFLEWGSVMRLLGIDNKTKPEWLILKSDGLKATLF